jgi:hypothetical protein
MSDYKRLAPCESLFLSQAEWEERERNRESLLRSADWRRLLRWAAESRRPAELQPEDADWLCEDPDLAEVFADKAEAFEVGRAVGRAEASAAAQAERSAIRRHRRGRARAADPIEIVRNSAP